jgi:hypothetical protein
MGTVEDILTNGLLKGFAGQTIVDKISRVSTFPMKESVVRGKEGMYVDQWTPGRWGGGQELAKDWSGKMMTRLYCGGVVKDEILAPLGITEKDVMKFLKSTLLELGEKTRLYKDARSSDENNQWRYSYRIFIEGDESDNNLTVAVEEIYFQQTRVFVHNFMICPVF